MEQQQIAGFKPQLQQELNAVINELVSTAHIPDLIVQGFAVKISQVLERNAVKKGGHDEG